MEGTTHCMHFFVPTCPWTDLRFPPCPMAQAHPPTWRLSWSCRCTMRSVTSGAWACSPTSCSLGRCGRACCRTDGAAYMPCCVERGQQSKRGVNRCCRPLACAVFTGPTPQMMFVPPPPPLAQPLPLLGGRAHANADGCVEGDHVVGDQLEGTGEAFRGVPSGARSA